MKGKDLKKILIPLTLTDRSFMIAFDFNALCELEEVYGDFNKAIQDMQIGKLKAMRAMLYSAIKPRNEDVTLVEIGELMTELITDEDKMSYVTGQLEKAIDLALPSPKEQEEAGESVPLPVKKKKK